MSRAPLLLVGGAFVLLHTTAAAVPAPPAEPRAALPRDDGLALLEEAARAARRLSYRGTQMVSFWSESGTSSALIDVAHVGGKGLLLRVAPTPQNPGGAVYDDESGDVPEVVGLSNGALGLLATHYDVGVEGPGEVAGRPAYVVTVRRPGEVPAARFWIDRATRLPLRREVLDGGGRTIRASAFIQLHVGGARVSDTVIEEAAPMPAPHGAPAPDAAALRADGWHVADRLPSGMELVDARVAGAGDATTVHLTYTDGLSTVSLFQQKGVLDEASVAGWRRVDLRGEAWVQDAFPRRVVWAGDGIVFTVVADCPQAALDDLVGTLPHGNPGPGIMDRMGNGLTRVASWANPFG